MNSKRGRTKQVVLLACLLLSAVLAMFASVSHAAQEGKPNLAFGKVQVVIQLPPNPGLPFTCSNLKEALVATDGSGKLPPVEGPVKVGPNNCSAKFNVQVGKQYQIAVVPTGVTCPVGKKLNFDLNWLGSPIVTLNQPGGTLLRQGKVAAIGCISPLP